MVSKKLDTMFQNFKYNVRLTGVTRVYFNKSEWESGEPADKVSWPYLMYRAVYFLYFFIFLIINIIRSDHPNYYMIMATNWSFLFQTSYGLVYFSNLAYRFVRFRRGALRAKKQQLGQGLGDPEVSSSSVVGKNQQSRTSASLYVRKPTQLNIFDSVTWLLLNIAGTVPYIVSVGYWAFVFNESTSRAATNIFFNLTVHGFNAVIALLDTFIIGIPIRVAHAVYTIAFTFIYLLFSVIYEYGGGSYPNPDNPYIYSLLKWRDDPEMTVLNCFIALIGAFLLHILLWLLYRLRMYLVPRLRGPAAYSLRA